MVREPLAYLVYIPLSCHLSADHDYMVWAEYLEAQSFCCSHDIDDSEIVPLYRLEK